MSGHVAENEMERTETFGTHTEINGFDHVDECFILLVFDVSTPPACCPCCLGSDLGRLLLSVTVSACENIEVGSIYGGDS